jgi:hypothetical protein
MAAICRKTGCAKDAVESLVRVTDLYRTDLGAEVPFSFASSI